MERIVGEPRCPTTGLVGAIAGVNANVVPSSLILGAWPNRLLRGFHLGPLPLRRVHLLPDRAV